MWEMGKGYFNESTSTVQAEAEDTNPDHVPASSPLLSAPALPLPEVKSTSHIPPRLGRVHIPVSSFWDPACIGNDGTNAEKMYGRHVKTKPPADTMADSAQNLDFGHF